MLKPLILKTVFLLYLSFLLLFFLFNSVTFAISVTVGEVAPDFTLNSVDWGIISLNEYRDKIVVLIYWKTEQKRSLMAMEDIQDTFWKYREKGVQVIGIIGEPENYAEIHKIVKDYKIVFPVLLDSSRDVYGNYGIRVYPSTVIIDREGKLAYSIPGHALTYKLKVEGTLQFMLGEINEEQLKDMISPPQKKEKDKSVLAAERRYNLALRFLEARLIEQAIEAVESSIEARSDIAKSHTLLGFLFLEVKETDKAFQEFNRATEIDPLSHDAKTGLGEVLILKGDFDRAIEILSDASSTNPHSQRIYYELGKAYALKGEKDKSIVMYKQALETIFKKHVLPSSILKCK